jgi:hypothetical protein
MVMRWAGHVAYVENLEMHTPFCRDSEKEETNLEY